MRARKVALAFGRLALLAFLAVTFLACGDATATARMICRGDSVRADWCDTCLVRCEVFDSLARR